MSDLVPGIRSIWQRIAKAVIIAGKSPAVTKQPGK
jgi:hypothetical protein